MFHRHLTLEKRIVIELFMHREHELPGNRPSSCPKKTKDARHYRCLTRPELLAYVDEKLRND